MPVNFQQGLSIGGLQPNHKFGDLCASFEADIHAAKKEKKKKKKKHKEKEKEKDKVKLPEDRNKDSTTIGGEDGVYIERTKRDIAFLDSDSEGEQKEESGISLQQSLK